MSQKQREKDQRRKARKAKKAQKAGGVAPTGGPGAMSEGEKWKTLKLGPQVRESIAMLREGLMVPLWQVAHKGRSMCAIVHALEREPAWEEAEKVLGVALGPVEGWTCVPMGVGMDLPSGWMWAAHPFSAPGYVPFAFQVADREHLRETMRWVDVKGGWGIGRLSDAPEPLGTVQVDEDPSVTATRGIEALTLGVGLG